MQRAETGHAPEDNAVALQVALEQAILEEPILPNWRRRVETGLADPSTVDSPSRVFGDDKDRRRPAQATACGAKACGGRRGLDDQRGTLKSVAPIENRAAPIGEIRIRPRRYRP